MFNVLTDNFKNEIYKRYGKRRLVVWLIAIIFLQTVFLIFLIPSHVYLTSAEKEMRAPATNQITDAVASSSVEVASTFRYINDELSALSSVEESNNFQVLIQRIVELKGPSIKLIQISYKTNTATTSVFTLRGVAVSRDSLLSYSKRLEGDTLFEKVDLPVSNFAKDRDIEFSLGLISKM